MHRRPTGECPHMPLRERRSYSPSTRWSPRSNSFISDVGRWPTGASRSVSSRVTRAVTLTTESLGRPEAAAGRNTLPGIAARAVLEVMTAAMVVFSRLVLNGSAWTTRTGRRLAGLLCRDPGTAGVGVVIAGESGNAPRYIGFS